MCGGLVDRLWCPACVCPAGCPRLPPGGLSSLQPRLTVVRKQPTGERSGSLSATPVGSMPRVSVCGEPERGRWPGGCDPTHWALSLPRNAHSHTHTLTRV